MGLTVYNYAFTVQTTLDFGHEATQGEQDWAITTVTAPWVTGATNLTCTFASVANLDHDSEDWGIENLTASAQNIVPGVSFDVYGYAPLNTWGRYLVNVVGV